ncbi:MAG: Ig-like domain-containing protein, partial [Chloroflexi bacterium]|nr:Ig-like domain-containing protein [Chloroflexota bacterium]
MDPFQSFSDTFRTLAGGQVKRTRRPGEVFEECEQGKSGIHRLLAFKTVLAAAVVLALLLLTLSASAQGSNQPPVASPDIYTTPLDTQLDLLPDVLANDSDPDGDPLTLVSFEQPDNGSVVDNSGVLTYAPDTGFEGLDLFDYTITDGTDNSTGKAYIEVGSVDVDLFEINLGDSVSNGVPGAGAGNLEVPGAEDVYLFQAGAGQSIVLNWLSGSNSLIGWRLQGPDDSVLFDTRLQDHQAVIPVNGTYTLTLYGLLPTSTGLYSFDLLSVPTSEAFTINIGDTISNGVPAPGAGNLEVPGAVDVYSFDGTAGQEVIFDWLGGVNVLIGWRLNAPDGTVLFDSVLVDYQEILPQTGTYMLTLRGNGIDDFGVYAFQLVNVPPAQVFNISIGDTVSDGVPAPGAGNLEAPGAVDVYTFDGTAGQEVIFDWLGGVNVLIGWRLNAPDGIVLFDSVLVDYQEILPQTGTYMLTLRGNGIDDFGLYSFRLLTAGALQVFNISIGDIVSDGVPEPGAGNLEGPGALDIYHFDGIAGQEVIFDYLAGENVFIGWRLNAPDGTILFDSVLADYQEILPQTGTYTLTLRGNGID